MATKTKYILMVQKLYCNGHKIERYFFDNKEIHEAYYNNLQVFSRELFELTTSNIELDASGAKISDIIADYVVSNRTSRGGKVNDVIYVYDDFTVEPNKTTLEKTGKFKVGQQISNLESEINYTQAADETTISYSEPKFIKAYADQNIGANGDAATIVVEFTQLKYESHSYGEVFLEEIHGTVEADSIVGEQLIKDLYTYADGGMVYGTNLKKTETPLQDVFLINELTFTSNGKSVTVPTDLTVSQEANIKTTNITYYLKVVSSETEPNAAKQSIGFDVSSTRIEDYSFTSGSTDTSGVLDTICHVSTTAGTLSATSVDNGGSVDLSIGPNTSLTLTKTYNVTFNNGKSETITIIQQKDAVANTTTKLTGVVNTPQIDGDVGANGSAVTVAMTAQANIITTYVSGEVTTTTGSAVNVIISSMTTHNNITFTGNTCGGNDLGTTITPRLIIYYITKVVGTVGDTTVTWNAPTTTTLPVYQEANTRWEYSTSGGAITYGNVTAGTITNATIPASGGSATAKAGNGSQTWNKGAVYTTYKYTSGHFLENQLTAAATSGTNSVSPNYSNLTKSASSKGTTTSAQTTVGSQKVTWTGSAGKTATGTMYVYQAANTITDYSAITIVSHGSASDVPVTGGTVRGTGGSGNQTITYTSGSTRAGSVACGTYTAITGSHLHKTETVRTKLGNSTATLTGEGNKTTTVSVAVYQAANIRTRTYGEYSVSATNKDENDIPATGGTFEVFVTARRAYRDTYTTQEYTDGYTGESGSVYGTNTSSVTPTSFIDSATVTATVGKNTGNARTCSVTVSCGGKTATASKSQYTGIVREVATVVFHIAKYTNNTTISYDFDVTAEDTSKYSGGSVGSVKIYLNTQPNATGDNATNKTLANSLTIAEGGKQNYSGTISVGSNYAGKVYLLVYLNNKLTGSTSISGYNGGGSGGGGDSGDEEAPEE